MKILIITHYFPPTNSIASHRPYSWAKYWSQMGHDVTVLTGQKKTSSYDLQLVNKGFKVVEVENKLDAFLSGFKLNPKEKEAKNNNNDSANKETLTLKVKKAIKNYFHRTGIVTWDARMPNKSDYNILQVVKAVNHQQWDLVISTFAPYANHLVAYQLKKQNKAKFWIADYRDLWTQSHLFRGVFPFNRVEEWLEKKVNQSADIITTVSQPLAEQLRKKYNADNVHIIENGFDLDILKNLSTKKYWSDNKIRLVYTGTIYIGNQDPSPLLKAIRAIAQSDNSKLLDNLEVVFVGGIKANLDQLVEQYNLAAWVKHAGFVTIDDALKMQRDADAVIFLEFIAPNIDGILTGKLFEYMNSATEIWAIGTTVERASGKLISDSNTGECFGVDEKRIENKLVALLKSKQKPIRNRNMSIVEKYSRKKLAEKLLALIDVNH